MYKREIETELQDLASGYQVVTVTGPRQSGKTTLVRHVFSDKPILLPVSSVLLDILEVSCYTKESNRIGILDVSTHPSQRS